ncbi:MAG: histidinol-phosphatase HisJ family protein [Chloroflexota bacterium]|jgi:histidinol-phosphatase (PHP family)|nr:histidinol-phosphatase HisJ family protein [Chloroflexota bacterium]MDH5243769.1 histidinol-phosphatase HisJ family protein [Chloroflexota bacterium]
MSAVDRRARDLPLDAHLHTDLSPDSDVPIDSYAAQAVDRGIAELAITDHVDFDPAAPAFAHTTFAQRERVVREAAERWADQGVAIRFGVEITWDSRWAGEIRDHLARHSYDFIVGSVHVYEGSPYAAEHVAGWVAGKTLAEIVSPYFEEVEAAAQSGLFDALGHLDFVKRYLVPHVTIANLAAAPELYEPILRALVDTGTALEINTSGLRQAAGETYPSAAIAARYRAMGGRAVTVGSDAHRAGSFAWALEDGYAAAAAAGFETLAFRRGAAPVAVGIPAGLPNDVAVGSL